MRQPDWQKILGGSMSNNTGGSAFPIIPPVDSSGEIPRGFPYADAGMTLRDYFAAKAMAAMCTGGRWPDSIDRTEISKRAYLMADCMLKAREEAC